MHEKKVALITGANKGLGLEIARQLGAQGVTVVLGARDIAKGEAAVAELKAEGIDAHAVKLEVTSEADVNALPEFFQDKFGRLDILVNNAGIQRDFAGATREGFRETFETNVTAPYFLTQTLLPLLKASPAGRIVNHSSILGSIATVSSGAVGSDWLPPSYNSSKSALNMLTAIQAIHLQGTNVKVNAAHPGWVKTELGGPEAPLELVDGAKTAVRLALLPDDGPSGGYFHMEDTLPW